MKTLDDNDLALVSGGASANDQIAQTLNAVQSSIKDLANQNKSSSNDLLLPMMMMAMNRPAPTVVASGAAAAPVVNISTRVRRW